MENESDAKLENLNNALETEEKRLSVLQGLR